jgi:hypothetical protein
MAQTVAKAVAEMQGWLEPDTARGVNTLEAAKNPVEVLTASAGPISHEGHLFAAGERQIAGLGTSYGGRCERGDKAENSEESRRTHFRFGAWKISRGSG